MLNYKKPAFWLVCAAVLVVAAGAISLLLNRSRGEGEEWQPQPEYKDLDELWEALAEAKESDRTEEIAAEDTGDHEKTAQAWMEAWLDMYKELPKDNQAHIAEWAIDSLDIIRSQTGASAGICIRVGIFDKTYIPIGQMRSGCPAIPAPVPAGTKHGADVPRGYAAHGR